jgi:hypothetical protein
MAGWTKIAGRTGQGVLHNAGRSSGAINLTRDEQGTEERCASVAQVMYNSSYTPRRILGRNRYWFDTYRQNASRPWHAPARL